ncbi:MAG: histidinol-phosphate aminotransferase, histidinol-phosphate aminotransferase [Candidatus Gottesmanbacteria bacterium GW2011_GWA2_43_14]|uniref:Histidinol-phosphate aminotransferase, histidinol-phosphate aminotransferase n=1 Tax=Candidatus Gottesmanbacteria bacterium GW2011_GWA2_43_14 TaxID=1618443 RepID=A0A0G1GCM2_9BACT|nr:MAG: histidinol-phosphate aminotransferase, histidinol-phosphate aminotransferase [Candidatus Gottesmanbacteria bacterium GW2011_GWA2_43_14]
MTDQFFSKIAQTAVPYAWEKGVVPGMFRFDCNTLTDPPACLDQFLNDMKRKCPINEYGDPDCSRLKALIAVYEKIKPNQVTVTNSGDEAIDILAKTFLDPGDKFMVTPPTYEMFQIQSQINGGKRIDIPLTGRNFRIDKKEIIARCKKGRVKLIFLCNPNNPTGSVIHPADIEEIVGKAGTVVVVDEAYREFYGKTSVGLISKYNNLVILRSFSKFGSIAGARVGYLLANQKVSEKFDAIRLPMGVSYFSSMLAERVLEDKNWIIRNSGEIIRERTKLAKVFRKLGFEVYDSAANFLLVRIGDKAGEICRKLKSRKILVRDLSNQKYLEGCVRITVRSKNENKILVCVLKEILNEK